MGSHSSRGGKGTKNANGTTLKAIAMDKTIRAVRTSPPRLTATLANATVTAENRPSRMGASPEDRSESAMDRLIRADQTSA